MVRTIRSANDYYLYTLDFYLKNITDRYRIHLNNNNKMKKYSVQCPSNNQGGVNAWGIFFHSTQKGQELNALQMNIE